MTCRRPARLWSNAITKAVLDGWHLNGNGSIYAGTPYTVGCAATGQPSQFWTGTPTAYLPFRCQMGSNIFTTDGSLPSKTEDPRLQVPLNTANFTLPAGQLAGHRQHAADAVLRSVAVESRLLAG